MMVLGLLFVICRNIIEEMKQTECLWRLLKYFTTTAVDSTLLSAHSLIENQDNRTLSHSVFHCCRITIFLLLMRFNPLYETEERENLILVLLPGSAGGRDNIMGFIFCKMRKAPRSLQAESLGCLSLTRQCMKNIFNSSLSTDYLHCIYLHTILTCLPAWGARTECGCCPCSRGCGAPARRCGGLGSKCTLAFSISKDFRFFPVFQ